MKRSIRRSSVSFRSGFDLSLYLVLDPACCAGRDVVDVAIQAVQGGVTMIQLRNKGGDEALFAAQAAMISEIIKPFNIPFLINDNVGIAKSVEADGVHLGQGDMQVSEARAMLGDDKIIGLTAFTPDHMTAIDPAIVDYAGSGPVFDTKTDKGKPVIGPDGLAGLVNLSPVPVVGIGGITPERAGDVIRAGARGVAMMRAISEAQDPQDAAREFHIQLARAKDQT